MDIFQPYFNPPPPFFKGHFTFYARTHFSSHINPSFQRAAKAESRGEILVPNSFRSCSVLLDGNSPMGKGITKMEVWKKGTCCKTKDCESSQSRSGSVRQELQLQRFLSPTTAAKLGQSSFSSPSCSPVWLISLLTATAG